MSIMMKTAMVAAVVAMSAGSALARGEKWSRNHFDEEHPEGNWLCTVEFGDQDHATTNWIMAEGRRLMLDKVTTAPGEKKTLRFCVNTRNTKLLDGDKVRISKAEVDHERWDDRLTIDVLSQGAVAPSVKVEPAPEDTVTIFVAGDSTVCCYNEEPYGSWGQMLPAFFNETVAIANHAHSGRALSSFRDERRQDKVLEQAKPGDWLFIQFGHNDQKEKVEFDERMRRYNERLRALVAAFRAKGGHVALISPMERRRFDGEGKPFKTLQEYEDAMSAAAKELNIPFINLHDMSYRLYTKLGEKESQALFTYRCGELDNTHHNTYGGYELARAVVEGIKSEIPGLAARLRPGIAPWSPETPDANPRIPRIGRIATEKPEEK